MIVYWNHIPTEFVAVEIYSDGVKDRAFAYTGKAGDSPLVMQEGVHYEHEEGWEEELYCEERPQLEDFVDRLLQLQTREHRRFRC